MTKLRISDKLALPLEFVTSTQAILAQKGKGKSYTGSVEAEELLDAQQQVVIIDPTDAWWGLRSSPDGKSTGYAIPVFGGDHADLPLEVEAAEMLATAIATEHFSAIICTENFSKGAELRFMWAFLETLYRKNRTAMHLFVDEADIFAPQKPFGGDEARVLGAMQNVVRRGRKKGIGCTLISQRAQVLNKDVLSQIDQLVAMGMNHPLDLDAVEDWVARHDTKKVGKAMIESIPSLPRGDAWVWNPMIDLLKRVTIRARRTFDSGATPKPGEKARVAKVLAPIDLERLGQTIKASAETARINDPKLLKAKVAELERSLERSLADLRTAIAARPAPVVKVTEKPVPLLDKGMLGALLRGLNQVDSQTENLDKVRDKLAQAQQVVVTEAGNLLAFAKRQLALTAPPEPSTARKGNGVMGYEPRVRFVPKNPAGFAPKSPIQVENGDDGLSPAKQKIIDTLALLAQLEIEATRETLAAWFGQHPNSKSYTNNLGALRSAGMLDGLHLTPTGRAAARAISIPTQEHVRELILRPLKPAQRRIVDILLDAGRGLSRDELAAELGMHPNTKVVTNNIGALRTRQLVTKGWPIEAGRVLYMEGAG